MKVTIKEFIQFEAGACFRPFADKVVQLRTEATYENDDAKQLTAKLFGNSGNNSCFNFKFINDSAYGKNAEDVTKHLKHRLITDDDELISKRRSRYFKESNPIYDETNDSIGTLTKERKPIIRDSKPIHVGCCILAWSKLLFYR